MDKSYNQKIKCTVESCSFNNFDNNLCQLNQIEVKACPGCFSRTPQDESMCGSYKCKSIAKHK